MMDSEAILEELRAIRILLTIDKKDELNSQLDEYDDIHEDLLAEYPNSDWIETGDIQETLAEKHNVTERTLRNRQRDLVEAGFVLHRQSGDTHEYKKSGLTRTLELIN